MAYCTLEEIEARTGYAASDFKQAGVAMTTEQWAAETARLIAEVSSMINRHCRRGSFEETEYTEYHDGDGQTGRETALVYYPREQPVLAITSVTEHIGDAWVDRAGAYDVIVKGSLTQIRFRTIAPQAGTGNVKVVYTAGYAAGNPTLDAIRGVALHMIATLLEIKKRRQEAIAARAMGTRDAADMVPVTDPRVFSRDVQERLAPYRRNVTMGRMWR